MPMRKLIAVLAGLLILLAVNFTIYQREKLLAEGRVVLLELAPVDPRSLMQGDYMALRFKVATEAFPGWNVKRESVDGRLVVALDERGIASFKRIADTTPLAANEALLRYRIRNGQVKFATNAFFFEEGQASQYQVARYGELRVSADGDMLLTNLRNADLAVLGGT
jgi:uncharacterized membrane-anchored protein